MLVKLCRRRCLKCFFIYSKWQKIYPPHLFVKVTKLPIVKRCIDRLWFHLSRPNRARVMPFKYFYFQPSVQSVPKIAPSIKHTTCDPCAKFPKKCIIVIITPTNTIGFQHFVLGPLILTTEIRGFQHFVLK